MTRLPARALVTGLVVASLGLAGCAGELTEEDKRAAAAYGSGHHGSAPTTSTSVMPSTFHTWRELASVVGCEATLQGKAADMRHAACDLAGDTVVLVDFDTTDGQRDWLDSALLYGGIYLVGDRWVLSGRSREYMESLRQELGGNIEESNEHGSS